MGEEMGEGTRERGVSDFLKLTDGQLHQLREILDERRVFERAVNGELGDEGEVQEIVYMVRDRCLISFAEADSVLRLCLDMVSAPDVETIVSTFREMGLEDEEVQRFDPVFRRLDGLTGRKEKAAPPRPHEAPPRPHELPPGAGKPDLFAFTYSKEYWDKLDALFYRTIGHFEDAFKTNKMINLVVVGLGVVFAGYGVVYSAYKGVDLFAVVFGVSGLGTSLLSYMFSPQREIQRNVGDLLQCQLMYRTYCHQEEAVLDWIRDNRDSLTLEELEKANDHLERVTKEKVDVIESLIGKG